jgi:hypothetical protein
MGLVILLELKALGSSRSNHPLCPHEGEQRSGSVGSSPPVPAQIPWPLEDYRVEEVGLCEREQAGLCGEGEEGQCVDSFDGAVCRY